MNAQRQIALRILLTLEVTKTPKNNLYAYKALRQSAQIIHKRKGFDPKNGPKQGKIAYFVKFHLRKLKNSLQICTKGLTACRLFCKIKL